MTPPVEPYHAAGGPAEAGLRRERRHPGPTGREDGGSIAGTLARPEAGRMVFRGGVFERVELPLCPVEIVIVLKALSSFLNSFKR